MNTTRYTYYKADGTIAYTKTRIDNENGSKRFYFEQPNGVNNMQGVQHEPYNLPAVISAHRIYFVEGEKCASAVIENGGVVTTLDTGANSVWQEHYTDYFADKEVFIIPDNDTAGMKYAKMVLKNIPTAKIIILPDLQEKQDIYDWLKDGHKLDEIDTLPSYDAHNDTGTDISLPKEETQAETIIRLVEENGTVLFHDTVGDPFAAIMKNGHQEIWAVDSGEFTTWLNSIYYKAKTKPAKKESLSQALAVLTAKALFDNEEAIPLQTRVAQANNEIWYFLSDSKCRAVKINESGWEIVDNQPILFRKYRHQKSQCLPKRKGDVWRILDYINLSECSTLFVCWLVSCFIGVPSNILYVSERVHFSLRGRTSFGILSKLVFFSTSEQALYRLLRLFYKSQSTRTSLLLPSKSNPLRWALIWLALIRKSYHYPYIHLFRTNFPMFHKSTVILIELQWSFSV